MKLNEDLLEHKYLSCRNIGYISGTFYPITDLNDLQVGESIQWSTAATELQNRPFSAGRCYCFAGWNAYPWQIAFYYNQAIIHVRCNWPSQGWTEWVRLQRPADVTSLITTNAIANGGNIYKNVNWNNLTQGFYVVNTWTGSGGSNYPAENLSGICIAFATYQICYAQNKIYTRYKGNDGWTVWRSVTLA